MTPSRRAHDGSAARRRAARHDRQRRRRGRGRRAASCSRSTSRRSRSCARCWATRRAVLPDEEREAGEATGVIHISSGHHEHRGRREGRAALHARVVAGRQPVHAGDRQRAEPDVRRGRGPQDPRRAAGHRAAAAWPSSPPGIDPQVAQVAQDALEREVNKFIAEVRRSLDYYLTQATQVRTIRRILLTGSGAQLRNLAGYLEKGLQARSSLARPARAAAGARRDAAAVRAPTAWVRAGDRPGAGGCGRDDTHQPPPSGDNREAQVRAALEVRGRSARRRSVARAGRLLGRHVPAGDRRSGRGRREAAGGPEPAEPQANSFKIFEDRQRTSRRAQATAADGARGPHRLVAAASTKLALVLPTDMWLDQHCNADEQSF